MTDLKTVSIFVQTPTMKKLLLFFSISAIIVSCGSNEECKDCNTKKEEPVKDTTEESLEDLIKKDTATTVGMTREQKINHEKIVKKYGEQWDFCNCVVALDSINDAVEKAKTDAQFDKLMARFEYVDMKCKEITTFDNQTPEERAKHDKRVMKCLKENGLKK